MGLLTEGSSAADRRLRDDLKKAVLSRLDERGGVSGGAVRWTDLYRDVSEQSDNKIDHNQFGDVVRSLETEGSVNVFGEGARRSIRRAAMSMS